MLAGCTELKSTLRQYTDMNRLMSDYEVTLVNDNSNTRPKPQRQLC